jgi:hypothetical protein
LQFGLRGTEGILTATGNGAASVTVVEPSKEIAEMVRSDLSEFSGGWPGSLPVEIRTLGARNFLARAGSRYDLIEAAEISSASFASLGIHATGETFLLTREGVRSALSRLTDRGMLAYSGWLKSPPRESVKILATIRQELERGGDPSSREKVLMVRGWGSFAILARRVPFSEGERMRAGRFCEETGFSMAWPPPRVPEAGGTAEEKALRTAVENTLAGPSGGRKGELFDLSPATDDSPYFHRFLRLRSLPAYRRLLGSLWVPFVEWGMVFLLVSLVVSLALSAACLLLPLAFARLPRSAGGISFAAYFSALGLGYMLIELTYLKIGILLLGDTIRAATAAIGGFTFFSGLGSAVSGRWEAEEAMQGRVCPGIAILALAGFLCLSLWKDALLPQGEATRILVLLVSLAPAAFLMGIPFPAALSRLSATADPAIPYAWGVNGFFSVAGASIASLFAMWIGFRWTIVAGGILYLWAGFLFARIGKKAGS